MPRRGVCVCEKRERDIFRPMIFKISLLHGGDEVISDEEATGQELAKSLKLSWLRLLSQR